MANQFFRFKQFLVNQDKCAMKVCTDSCLLGAYASVENGNAILDIGTGTGLLSLMAAQRSQASIKALEIEPQAAGQAQDNFRQSPWPERLTVVPVSLQEFRKTNQNKFDLILCNPPFYRASQKSPDGNRNTAMHHQTLTFSEIIEFARNFLTATGSLYLLLPPPESNNFAQEAVTSGLYLTEKLEILTQTGGKHIRTIQRFKLDFSQEVKSNYLEIRDASGEYSLAFKALLQPYYLHL